MLGAFSETQARQLVLVLQRETRDGIAALKILEVFVQWIVGQAVAVIGQENLLVGDKALYGAKAAGRNCCWQHLGEDVEPALVDEDAVTVG